MKSQSLSSDCLAAAQKLYSYLESNHLREDGALVGPDSGTRWQLRIGRFIKSYIRFRDWGDSGKYMLQAQGYWIMDNLDLFQASQNDMYLQRIDQCADVIISRQTDEGFWLYDNPEWKDRVATVEGCFAAIGLLQAYRATGKAQYLESADKWYKFMIKDIGFQNYDDESISLNYWAYRKSGMVPNNATLGLWLAAELADISGDQSYLSYAPSSINFLKKCQLPTGEFPYELYHDPKSTRIHYLCYQYHSFQFMDLSKYYQLTKDASILPLMQGVARFLANGILPNGEAKCNCSKSRPSVIYYTAALGAALKIASEFGLGDYAGLSDRAYSRVIKHQKPEGNFVFSYRNYGLLSDQRSYPRSQSMILNHLLFRAHQ